MSSLPRWREQKSGRLHSSLDRVSNDSSFVFCKFQNGLFRKETPCVQVDVLRVNSVAALSATDYMVV